MYSFDKVVAITNRHLCRENYYDRIEKIASRHPKMIIVREKDMEEGDYLVLLDKVRKICERYNVRFAAHSYVDAATKAGADFIHLPLAVAETNRDRLNCFPGFGVSVHSREDAVKARNLGAGYVVCGHIFETDCKMGVPPRGLELLDEVIEAFGGPVYAIGGIDFSNIGKVMERGASGACMMSFMMNGNF